MGGIDQAVDNPSTTNSLITAAKPGMNLFTLFDNMSEWSKDWSDSGVEGGIYINDVVISTNRIGHEYNVGNQPVTPVIAPPSPPTIVMINQ